MDEIEHVNPKRVSTRLTAYGLVARADVAALHERASGNRHADRPKADAQAIRQLARGRRAT